MHDRFLVGEKQRKKTREDSLTQATQQRVLAERIYREASQKLEHAEKMLEEAGWTKSRPEDWLLSEKWEHSTGFEASRIRGLGGATYWLVRKTHPVSNVVSVDGRIGYMRTLPAIQAPSYHATVEEALEWWRLQLIDLGRFPKPPLQGLFDRLRDNRGGVGLARGIQRCD